MVQPGIYPNLSFEEYRAIDALNWSTLSKLRESPAACKRYMESPPEASAAQDFGTAVHHYLLERESFWDNFVIWDGTPYHTRKDPFRVATNDTRNPIRRGAKWELFKAAAESDGKKVLTPNEMEKVVTYANRWDDHPLTKNILDGALTELSIIWECEYTGQLCKARIDLLTASGDIYDVKTTRQGNPYDFVQDAKRFGYIHQLCFYSMGYDMAPAGEVGHKFSQTIGFIACPKAKDPVDNLLVFTKHSAPDEYDLEVKLLLELFQKCKETDHWPEATQEESTPSYIPTIPFNLLTGEQQ